MLLQSWFSAQGSGNTSHSFISIQSAPGLAGSFSNPDGHSHENEPGLFLQSLLVSPQIVGFSSHSSISEIQLTIF